jgi:hypothetical protein
LKQIVGEDASAFEKEAFPSKVTILREKLGLELHLYSRIYSIIAVRNCLVHRRGIVGPTDVDSAGELKLSYQALEIYSPQPDGSGEVIFDQPGAAPENAPVMIRSVERTRVFHVGDRIALSVPEITQVFALLAQFSITTIGELASLIGAPSTPAAGMTDKETGGAG